MKTILAPRASAIIYDLLTSADIAGPFLLPANICPIVPITFIKAGVGFEFVDISADSLAIDLDQVGDRLESDGTTIGGLLYSHTYGNAATPHEFFVRAKARWPQLLVIDDRCLCPPQLDPEVGQSADVTLYSSGYAKIADLGFGGYAFVNGGLNVRHTTLPFQRPDLLSLEADYKACLRSGEPFVYRDCDWLETDSELPDAGALTLSACAMLRTSRLPIGARSTRCTIRCCLASCGCRMDSSCGAITCGCLTARGL